MTERLAEALAPALAARERAVPVRPGKTPAAVLGPLLPVGGEPHLLLTRRSRLLRAPPPPGRTLRRPARALRLRGPAGADRLLSGRRAHHLGCHPPHHAKPARRGADARLMRRFLFITLLAIAIALLVTRAEPLAPTVALETPVDVVGRATPLVVIARDRGTGLAHVEVRLAGGAGGAPAVVASEDFPRRSWLGSGVHEVRLTPTVDAAAA